MFLKQRFKTIVYYIKNISENMFKCETTAETIYCKVFLKNKNAETILKCVVLKCYDCLAWD